MAARLPLFQGLGRIRSMRSQDEEGEVLEGARSQGREEGQGGSGRVREGQGGSGRVREGQGGSGRVREGQGGSGRVREGQGGSGHPAKLEIGIKRKLKKIKKRSFLQVPL